MANLKLRILNQFGASEPLNSPDEIEVHFPYAGADNLIKRMSYGAVKILNDVKGEIEVELSPFEVQGLPVGDRQNFSVRLKIGSKIREAIFARSLNVRTMNDRKVIER